MPAAVTDVLDTTNCELEPIRFPGAVQPHGALLVLGAESGRIEAASESCAVRLGIAAPALLGRTLASVFEPVVVAGLEAAQATQSPTLICVNGAALLVRASRNAAGQVLIEFEPPAVASALSDGRIAACRQRIAALRRLSDIPTISQKTADLFRDATGFDRVMIYRFDDAWNGEVLAESRAADIEPYLGLNFPASDIPKQARELFQSSKVRQIAEVRYQPSALVALGDGRSIDLGLSSLRSVSPIHIEYLENMAVRATLVGSLVVEGRLWGLLSCQHKRQGKYFAPDEREALGWLCEDIAALIETAELRNRLERQRSLAMRRRTLVDAIRAVDFKTLMRQQAASGLLEVVAADGFALLIDDAVQTTGRTPSRERIRELQRHRRARESNPTLFASSAIGDDLGVGQADDGVAGALFVSLRGKPETTMIWFRNERSFSVRWGGDPEHPHFANDDGRLSPRKSFALFLQNVFGHSRPWSAEELESAAELGSLIEIEALREREAFSKTVFNSMPEHISVLDAEGRIVSVNTAWKRFAECNDAPELATQAVGLSYRNICSGADGSSEAMEASAAWAGIESVLNRSRPSFTLDYPCDSPSEPHWFRMRVHPMLAPNEGVIVAHENITEQKLAAARLQQSEAKIKGILEGAADAIFIIDREGRIQFVNNEASRLVGYGREQLLRMNIRDLAPPAGVTNSLVEIDRLLATGSLRGEFALRRSAGATLPVEVNATLLPDGSIFSSWRDITERHFTQAALYENEERFRLAFIKSPIGMMLCHLDGYIFKVNAAACLMTGYSENETIGRRLSDLVLRDSAAAEEIELFRRIAAGDIKSFSVQQEHVHKDGHVYIAQNSLSVVCDNANTPLYGIAHLEDLTERQRRQLEALAKQTLKAQEEERFRLSRELHDDIGQSLTALKLALQRAQRKSGNEEVLSFMQEASDGTRHLLEAVRNIAYRLRPAHLTDLGLMSSLRWHIDKVVRPTGLSCTLGGNLKEIRLPAELEVCCFRVAQEALNNVIKHARATRIEVHLDRLADSITLSVRDDGIGFDVSKAYLTAENANSLGLIGMRERIAAMNGWLEVNSSPGHGTEIIATLPLAEGVS